MKNTVRHHRSHLLKDRDVISQRSFLFWGIVLIALILRIGFILLLSPAIDAGQPLSIDALSYHQIAQNILEWQIFTSPVDPPYNPQLPSTFRPPLTPLYLAAIYSISGVNLLWARIGLAILSALSCGCTYWLGQKLFGQSTGLIAGLISCGYPFFLLLVHLPLTEGLSIFLSLVLITLLYFDTSPAQKTRTFPLFFLNEKWKSILIGIVFGLMLLNKAANITMFSCIVLWCLFLRAESFKQRLLRLLVIITVATMIILPWTIRNYLVTGTFILVNSNGGWTFYLGNNPYTEKNLTALEQGITNGWIPPKEVYQPFSDLSFDEITAWEKRSVQLGYAFIRQHPGKFINFALRKLKIFWSPYQHILDQLTWIPVAVFSIIGIGYSLFSGKQHLTVYVFLFSAMVIPIFFTSMPRFRAPLMPVLIIYSAAGLVKVYRLVMK